MPDQPGPHTQAKYATRFEWGPTGAAALADPGGIVVVVDVLSFSTAVCVAAERGIAVWPSPWDGARADELGRRVDAKVAVGRRSLTSDRPWSLSPASLLDAPFTPRLVLPSPNGSTIAAAVAGSSVVVAGCLRNARAVGRWLASVPAARSVSVIAAGERWPDGGLRPALEDLLGAGAIIGVLARARPDRTLSPEAASARDLFAATMDLPGRIRDCASGRELIDGGFGHDVALAVETSVSGVVPVLADGAFRAVDPL